MDEVFGFLATHVIAILFFGLLILIVRIAAVYMLIVSKSRKVTWSFNLVETNFFKTFTSEEITKSKSSKRKTLKKISNYTTWALYIFLVLSALGIFFKYVENRSSDEFAPSNNSTPVPSSE